MAWKKKNKEEGLDLISEAKEPFSFSHFFKNQLGGKIRYMKNILKEKGVLFFLFSPFQARPRLIAQMFLLAAGILFGVVPRATSLVGAVQDMAYESELSGLTARTAGDLTVTPAASSYYDRKHVLAFVLSGKNLPSDVSRYDVQFARSYGASDWADVSCTYDLFPVDNDRRILLVCLDQTTQASGYGAFRLLVTLDGEELKDYELENAAFEVVISTAQETTDLYNAGGVHLSALTEAVLGTGRISEAESSLTKALSEYQIAAEQAESFDYGITVSPSAEDLETYCLQHRLYRELTDASTVDDLTDIREAVRPELSVPLVLTSGGIAYDGDWMEEHIEADGVSVTEEERAIAREFEHLTEALDGVISAMDAVNVEAETWYNILKDYALVLGRTVQVTDFKGSAGTQAVLSLTGTGEEDETESTASEGMTEEPVPSEGMTQSVEPVPSEGMTEEPASVPSEGMTEEPASAL